MADTGPTTKLFFLSQIDNLRDPVRNTRWRVLIPSDVFAATGINVTNGDQFNNGEEGTDEFALHVKACKIPSIKVNDDTHEYMGFKQHHPVNAEISTEITFSTILLEDMRAYEAMLAWEQSCLNTGILVNESNEDRMNQTGLRLGLGTHKDASSDNTTQKVLRNSNVKVELYNWMRGDVIMRLNLINAFPTSVGGFDLKYDQAGLIKFEFTLKCDRWTVQIPKDYKTGL